MKVALIDGGGRGAAIASTLFYTGRGRHDVTHIYNIGKSVAGGYFAGSTSTVNPNDDEAIASYVAQMGIDFVVPAREAELCAGLVDRLTARGITVVGPVMGAARLEGSKAFLAELCETLGIPAPRSVVCRSLSEAYAKVRVFLRDFGILPVIKASGLAAGKGVFLPATLAEAEHILRELFIERALGDAGVVVVLQERLVGQELSLFALCDGAKAVCLGTALDYKRLFAGDQGPNTGGMGSVSPVPFAPVEIEHRVMREVVRQLLWGMAHQGTPYRGVMYCGLMLTSAGPKLLEVNVRFGDPEAQALLPRLDQVNGPSLAELLLATTRSGELDKLVPRLQSMTAVCVVMAAEGYPSAPKKGDRIDGLMSSVDDTEVFHAGTRVADDGRTFLTDGGRVLNVVGFGPTVGCARERAYARVNTITWDGEQHRPDIAEGM